MVSARIGLILPDGRIKSIFCVGNGGFNEAGRLLFEHYRDSIKVESMINLGYINILGPSTETTRYSSSGISADITGQEYFDLISRFKLTYLFVNGDWYFKDGTDTFFYPLTAARTN